MLKEPETKGRELWEPQTGLTQLTTLCTNRSTRASLRTVSTVPWAPVSTNRQECLSRAPRKMGRHVQSSVLCSAPLSTWVNHYILNIHSKRNQNPSTNWFPSKLGVCYMPLLSGSNFTGTTLTLFTKFWFQYVRKLQGAAQISAFAANTV